MIDTTRSAYDRLALPPQFGSSVALYRSTQHAFQEDQLTTLLSPVAVTLLALTPPAFTAEELDQATNRLFHYPATTSPNPYGFAPDELIDYPDAIYQKRFRQITSDIPLVYNHQVKNFIDVYASRNRDQTQRMLGKSTLYYPYIEEVLAEKQMPDVLKHLVMVESALQTEAYSPRAAVGLWQIRYATGRELGLEINSLVDQRLDPYAATRAATDYLLKLYKLYDDWLLAIAAYNCGLGNLNKAIVRSGGSSDFWRVSRYLPQETRSYVPALMAIAYLYDYQAEHNLHAVYPILSFRQVDTVRLYRETTLESIAATAAVSLDELTFLNPSLIRNRVPYRKDGYVLVLPINKIARFEKLRRAWVRPPDLAREVAQTARITREKQPIEPKAPNLRAVSYTVRSGNTIWDIARHYGCSVKEIQDWNGKRDHVIRVGEELTLYVPKTTAAP